MRSSLEVPRQAGDPRWQVDVNDHDGLAPVGHGDPLVLAHQFGDLAVECFEVRLRHAHPALVHETPDLALLDVDQSSHCASVTSVSLTD